MNKRVIALNIMDDNADKSMADVCHIIAKEANMTYAMARAYYTWGVETNRAPGVIVHEKRGRKLGFKLQKNEVTDQVNDPEISVENPDDYCNETYNDLKSIPTEKKYELDVIPEHPIPA